jgi:acyl carrier protein
VTREEILAALRGALSDVAPEADLARLDAAASLRDQLDIDSVDFLNFILGVHARLGVDVPEADYPKLSTLEGCVSYLDARLARL